METHKVSFSDDVDLMGILNKLGGKGFIHGEDNVLYYYERKLNEHWEQRLVVFKEERDITLTW